MPGMQEDADSVDFCEISPELSRNFRGLAVWLAVQACGLAAFRASLDEKLDLVAGGSSRPCERSRAWSSPSPQLSLFAFRLAPEGSTLAEANRLSRELMARVNARQRVLLTSTLLGDDFADPDVHPELPYPSRSIGMALDDLRAASAELARGIISGSETYIT